MNWPRSRALSLALAGCLGLWSASAAGAWELAREDGAWWFKDEAGRRFLSLGVNTVNGGQDTPKARTGQAYFWKRFDPDEAACLGRADQRLRLWGFNTLGGMSDDADHGGAVTMPFIVTLYLGSWAELLWTDPFDPAVEERAVREAERLTAPYRNNPRLLGYFTDNEIGWWNSPIFGFYLKQGWGSFSKRVLWNLLRETYCDDWSRLLVDFVPNENTTDWESLKNAGAELKLRPGGQGIAVVNRFTGLTAGRYYALVHDALKKAHPQALVLGDRLPLYYNQSAVLAARDHVDALSTNYNVDVQDGWVAPYYYEGLARLIDRPVLVSEYFFAARENRSGNVNNGHLMTVTTQAERAQGAAEAMRQFAAFPNVVGVHWFQYYDEPQGGRETDGENYNFGLTDIHDRPYEELTAALTRVNAEVPAIHARAERGAPADSAVVPWASRPLSVTDGSLIDWDKAATRLTGFHTPAPFVPFGDVHLAWRPEGLYLSCIAQNYLDWRLLAFDGTTFPLSEVFQVHLRLDGPSGPRHYAVCLMPEISARYRDSHAARLEIRPRVLRFPAAEAAPQDAPEVQARQIEKPLPHIAFEAFVPASALGLRRLGVGQELTLNIWATSFYRELTMTWADSVESARPVRLGGKPAAKAPVRGPGRAAPRDVAPPLSRP